LPRKDRLIALLPPIDYRSIRPKPPRGTQADGFEELVSELLRDAGLIDWPHGTRFERFGNPDGGREGRGMLPGGETWCWQAKYYFSLTSSALADVRESFERALQLEPTMARYYVAMPFDLAAGDRVGAKSAKTRWDDWVAAQQEKTSTLGRTVQIIFIGDGELGPCLRSPAQVGHLRYWFDEDSFSESDFERVARDAVLTAGPRFSPDTNVTLPIARTIDALARGPVLVQMIQETLIGIRKASQHGLRVPSDADDGDRDAITEGNRLVERLVGDLADALLSAQASLPIARDLECYWTAVRAVSGIRDRMWDAASEGRLRGDRAQVAADAGRILEATADVGTLLRSDAWDAWSHHAVLLTGTGGAGKTHLLCDTLVSRIGQSHPTVLLMAEQFELGNSIEAEVARLSGFSGPPAQLLPALEIAAQARNSIALIMIDGLNEVPDRGYWKRGLEAFLERALGYDHIRVLVSCRTEFLDETITSTAAARMLGVEHDGFVDLKTEQLEAYVAQFGIRPPTSPIIEPDFTNPLVLKLICTALQRQGETSFPRQVGGLSWLSGLILGSVNAQLASSTRCDYPSHLPLVQRMCDELARRSLEGSSVPFTEALAISDDLLPNRAWSASLLQGLLKEGLLAEVRHGDETQVRFAYERLGDITIARTLLDFGRGEAIAKCNSLAANWYRNAGVLGALTAMFPETYTDELLDVLTSEDWRWEAEEAFVESLKWRSVPSITARTEELAHNLLEGADHRWELYSVLLVIGSVVDHPLNIEWLERRLSHLTLPARDATWTDFLNHDADNADVARRLSDWVWSPRSAALAIDEARLAAVQLVWMLGATRRRVRDNATKALVCLLEEHSSIASAVLDSARQSIDPYIEERAFAATYGAAARASSLESKEQYAAAVIRATLDRSYWPVHLLTRHYARRVVEIAADSASEVIDDAARVAVQPPYGLDVPAPIHSRTQIRQMTGAPDYVYVGIGTSLMSDFGDFRKYIINPALRHIDIPKSISPDDVAGLIFDRVVNLGWTPETLGPIDKAISRHSEREDRIERIGKKYQWIAYWEILGRLADNYPMSRRYDELPGGPYDEPNDIDDPDIDPSCLLKAPVNKAWESTEQTWFATEAVAFPTVSDRSWVTKNEGLPSPGALINVASQEDSSAWVMLEGHLSWEEDRSEELRAMKRPHLDAWMQFRSYVVHGKDLRSLESWTKGRDWMGRQLPWTGDPYGLFLAEHPYGSRWPTLGPLDEHDRRTIPVPFEMPSTRYGGTGSDWDASESRHVRGLVPSTMFARALSLRRFDDFLWSSAGYGVVAANFGVRDQRGPDALFIRRDHLERWVARTGSALFTTVTAEKRLLYPDPGRREREGEPLIRSLSGTYFFDEGGSRFVSGSGRTLHAGGVGSPSEVTDWIQA
jgi:hypothetical protein